MSVESDICAAVVTVMRAAPSLLPMLGESDELHVEQADDVDATIVRGGLGRCLVRPSDDGARVAKAYPTSALVTYRIALEFDVHGGGGVRAVTRSNVQRAVISLFGDSGAALMAAVNSADRLGGSGIVEIESVEAGASDDPRKPKVIATLAVTLWQNIPETV